MKNYYLTQENANKSVARLLGISASFGLLEIAEEVLGNEKFITWSGSSKPTSHHYGRFGLVIHTDEVYKNAAALYFVNKDLYDLAIKDEQELFLSVLFHDYGKIYDYKAVVMIIRRLLRLLGPVNMHWLMKSGDQRIISLKFTI